MDLLSIVAHSLLLHSKYLTVDGDGEWKDKRM